MSTIKGKRRFTALMALFGLIGLLIGTKNPLLIPEVVQGVANVVDSFRKTPVQIHDAIDHVQSTNTTDSSNSVLRPPGL